MKSLLGTLVCALAIVAGCGGAETGTGGGGSGQATTATAGSGGGRTCTHPKDANCIPIEPEPEGGAGGEGGGSVVVPTSQPVYPMTAADIVDGLISGECGPFAPGASEDGSWVRVQMRSAGGARSALRFAVARTPSLAAPNPRVLGWGFVAEQLGPAQVNCTTYATSYTLVEVDGESTQDASGNAVEVVIFEFVVPPSESAPGDWDVACLRMDVDADGEGHPGNLIACGEGACLDDRDQWQDSKEDGGAIHAMGDYGPSYCRAWMVSVQ